MECFASQTEQDIFFANTHEEILPDAGNLSDVHNRAAFKAGLLLADVRNAVYARNCQERSGDAAGPAAQAPTTTTCPACA